MANDYTFPVMEFFPYRYAMESKSLTAPPSDATDGQRYIVAPGGTDTNSPWYNHDNQIAWLLNGTWYFDVPEAGWTAYVKDEDKRFYFDGNNWDTTYVKSAEKGQPNGVATLDANGKVPTSQLPDSVVSGMHYMGTWDASSGSYPSSNPNPGEYWIVNNGGVMDGVEYKPSDWIVYDANGWEKIDNTDKVTSVNGKTGDVHLDTDDVPEGNNNLYYTDARVSANPDVAANTQARLRYVPALRMAVATL